MTLLSGWNEKSFEEIADFINGKPFKPTDWSVTGIPIIRIQNLTDASKKFNYYTGSFDKRYLVKKGDILVSWSGTIGVYVWDGVDAVLNQHIFKVVPKDNLDKNYFVHAASKKIDEMIHYTHGSTMKHITRGLFLRTKIPVPPLSIQMKIGIMLNKAKEIKQMRQKSIEKLVQLYQAAFIQMFGDSTLNAKRWKIVKLKDICHKITDGTHQTPKYVEKGVLFLSVQNV